MNDTWFYYKKVSYFRPQQGLNDLSTSSPCVTDTTGGYWSLDLDPPPALLCPCCPWWVVDTAPGKVNWSAPPSVNAAGPR